MAESDANHDAINRRRRQRQATTPQQSAAIEQATEAPSPAETTPVNTRQRTPPGTASGRAGNHPASADAVRFVNRLSASSGRSRQEQLPQQASWSRPSSSLGHAHREILGSASDFFMRDPDLGKDAMADNVNNSIKNRWSSVSRGLDTQLDKAEKTLDQELEEWMKQDLFMQSKIMLLPNLLEMVKPRYESPKMDQAAREQQIYFFPGDPLPAGFVEQNEEQRLRVLEEEGFFVDPSATTSNDNWHRLEHRLRLSEQDQGKVWFDDNGRLMAQSSLIVRNAPAVHLGSDERLPLVPFKPRLNVSTKHQDRPTGEIYRLIINLYHLEFDDHYLMSDENRCAKVILRLVDELNQRKLQQVVEFHGNRIDACRVAFQDFMNRFPNFDKFVEAEVMDAHNEKAPSSRVSKLHVNLSEKERRLRYYDKLIGLLEALQNAKKQFEAESLNNRLLEWKIFKKWDELKGIRSRQGFSSTDLRIAFKQEETDKFADERTQESYIQCDLNERKTLYQLLMARRAETQQNLPETNENQLKKHEESVFFNRKDLSGDRRGEIDSLIKANPSGQISMKDSDTAYAGFDKNSCLEDIRKNVATCFRKPGSPIITVLVNHSEIVTKTESCPKYEQIRRSEIQDIQICVRILIKKKQVMKTIARPLRLEDFSVSVGGDTDSNITLQLSNPPKNVELEIHQKAHSMAEKIIARLEVQMPDPVIQVRTLDQEIVPYGFTSATLDPHELRIRPQEGDRLVRGHVKLILVWDVDDQNRPLAPKAVQKSQKHVSQQKNRASTNPNDPRQLSDTDSTRSPHYESHRVEERVQDDLNMGDCTMSKRNEVLRLRNSNKLIARSAIPFDDEDIGSALYEPKRLDEDLTLFSGDKVAARHSQSEFLRKIRMHELYRRIFDQYMERPFTFDDFVREERLPEKEEGSFLAELLKQRRPLKPERNMRPKSVVLSPTECSIVVQVIRGFNIPVRKADLTAAQSDRKNSKKFSDVCSYVEIQFQQHKERTASVEGANPQWNDTLILPFRPNNNDFKAETLQNVRDHLYLNIFDEVTIDLIQDERDKSNVVHQRKERNWLGTLSIPFSTIYKQVIIEGRFHMETPLLAFGYEKDRVDEFLGVNTEETMVHLFITLDPLLPQPDELKPKFDTDEDRYLLKRSQKWKEDLILKSRMIVTCVISLEGKTLFANRFISSQAPPPQYSTPEQVLRFVSMIPYIEDRTALTTAIELWSTSAQLLEIGAGDEAEHAILLCNYFLNMGIPSFVIVGRGIPQGKLAFVLTVDSPFGSRELGKQPQTMSKYAFFNPLTGMKYLPYDSHCPLKEVGCVFNDKNIWANVQQETNPSKINFNLKDASSWRPFADNREFDDMDTVQKPIVYREIPQNNIQELEKSISSTLIARIEKARGRFVTRWNRSCCRIFETILPSLELQKQGKVELRQDELLAELKKLQLSYRIRGFPLNFPFTDINSIVEAVHNTDVHSNQDPAAEFALAVYCHGYVNDIIGVWIYIASLSRIDRR